MCRVSHHRVPSPLSDTPIRRSRTIGPVWVELFEMVETVMRAMYSTCGFPLCVHSPARRAHPDRISCAWRHSRAARPLVVS